MEASYSSSSSSAITDLPSHILMEILIKLPIKTIVASKSVCKSWLHLINDPSFTKLHHATAKVEVCFQDFYIDTIAEINLYLGNFYFPNGSQFLNMKLDTLLELTQFSDEPDDLCIKATWRRPNFVNSCNGLLCYVTQSNEFALIWNPITSEFITLPAPERNKSVSRCAFGFGFSQKANRFKLLCIMGAPVLGWSVVAAKICTIEKGCSWKTIDHCANTNWRGFECDRFRAFLGGALHFIGGHSHSSDLIIVSFDFEDEKFGRFPLPPHLNTMININTCGNLGVLAGCLFVTETTNTSFNIWLMKEYGVQDSWTKVVSFNVSSAERDMYLSCRPINFLDNGELLMMRSLRYLFVYNPVLKSIREMGFHRLLLRVFAYSPSLVPLKDSIGAFEVHVMKSRHASLERRAMATMPSWWNSMEDEWYVEDGRKR